jgi:hypothetical protein
LTDQQLRQGAVHAPLRHALEIGGEIIGAVGRDDHGGEQRCVYIGHERADFLRPAMHETKAGPGIARIAAVLGFARLLEHHHPLGTRLPRRNRGPEGRAAAPNHDDVASLGSRHVVPIPVGPSLSVSWPDLFGDDIGVCR